VSTITDRRLAPGATRRSLTIIGCITTVLLCWIAVRDVRPSQIVEGLTHSDVRWFVPALVVFGVSIFLRVVRWRMLFEPARRPSTGAATRALLVGYFFNNLLPARAGEAARIIRVHNEAGVPRAEALTTILVERVFDVLSLLVVLFAALPWLPHVAWFRQAAILGALLAAVLAAMAATLAVFGDRPVRALLRPLRFLPAERLEFATRHTVQGLVAMRKPSVAFAAFAVTTASWLVMAVSFWLLMQGFDFGAAASAPLMVLVTVNLTMIVPSGPAALGVFEAGTVVALHAYGVSQAPALSYALVLHVLNFVPFVIVGGAVLLRRGIPLHLRPPIEQRAPS
jgi:glycosyltransferase 2 family protein